MKFYPSDWRSDPALRLCGLAARGLWIELLCIMHEADPRGFLLVNGSPLNERQVASLIGAPVKELAALLGELESAGVLSRNGAGVIFSRRIVRDAEKAATDKANGKLGGNPKLKGRVNPPDNRSLNGVDKAQKPDARVEPSQEGEISRTVVGLVQGGRQ